VNTKENWKFGHRSGVSENIQTPFFSIMDLSDYFSEYIKKKIENTISKKFKLNRNYMHIQTFGQDGCYHTDDNKSDTYTFCVYLTEISNIDIEISKGEFFIKIPNEKHIISFDTCCNRGVFFPSTYLHKGMGYDRFHSQKRVCITWKLEELFC
jgi:hypothetical protein